LIEKRSEKRHREIFSFKKFSEVVKELEALREEFERFKRDK